MGIDPEEFRIAMASRQGRSVLTAKPARVVPTRKERDIQAAILDAAKLWKGVRLWKTGGGLLPLADGRRVRMGVVGVSDLVGWKIEAVCPTEMVRGKPMFLGSSIVPRATFVAIEVKREKKYPTREQQAFLDAVRDAGGIALVARNVDDVRRVLQP